MNQDSPRVCHNLDSHLIFQTSEEWSFCQQQEQPWEYIFNGIGWKIEWTSGADMRPGRERGEKGGEKLLKATWRGLNWFLWANGAWKSRALIPSDASQGSHFKSFIRNLIVMYMYLRTSGESQTGHAGPSWQNLKHISGVHVLNFTCSNCGRMLCRRRQPCLKFMWVSAALSVGRILECLFDFMRHKLTLN